MRGYALARSQAPTFAILALTAGALLWQAREYMPFFVDDSFIALRYVWRLLHGHGLTWTDGERVEGYSDLLWLLLIAAGGIFDGDLVMVSRFMGVVTTMGAVLAIAFAYRPRRLAEMLPPLVGGLAIVLTSPVVAWSIGGLEQPLLAALVSWAIVLSYRLVDGCGDGRRTATRVGVLLGLAAITRPDAGLFAAATCGGLLATSGLRRSNLQTVARIGSIVALFILGQVVFRRAYYAAWLPNTAHVKLAFTWTRARQGWEYVAGAEPYLRSLLLMALAAAAASAIRRESRRRLVIALVNAVAWTAYVVVIGGDISPARRHLVVPIVLLALAIAEGVHGIATRGRMGRGLAAALAAVGLVTLARAQSRDPERTHALNDTWPWTGREVGAFLERAFAADRPLVAVDAAGSLPYFAPHLPCLDMLGLNDRTLATRHPPEFGQGFIGHELGDGDYLFGRRPDLIAFGSPIGDSEAHWRGGREMQRRPDFYPLYQLVRFETPEGVSTRLWVRREGRIGVTRTESEIIVPAYLFDTPPGGFAGLDDGGRLALRVDDSHPAFIGDLHPGPGHWSVRVEGSGDVEATITGTVSRIPAPDDADGSRGELRFVLRDDAPASITVRLRTGDRAFLRRVVFRRWTT